MIFYYKCFNYINKCIEIVMTVGNPSSGNQVYISVDISLEQGAHFYNFSFFPTLTESCLPKLLQLSSAHSIIPSVAQI
jgi:hypothetical protein